MKLKITIGFIIVSTFFLAFVFRDRIMVTNNDSALQSAEIDRKQYLEKLLALELRTYSGDNLKLDSEALGEQGTIILHFWASWCGPCVNEVPELIEYSRQNPQVKFIIISVDDYTEDISKFLKSFPAFGDDQYIKIWDGDKKVSKIFNVDRLPMSVIFQKEKSQPLFIKSVVDWKRIQI